ncbi:MAG: hypothetical protein HZB18_12040 [Chloroflexi bacterium]|nr:hypothetical protein [Chloroflexota bacterium]
MKTISFVFLSITVSLFLVSCSNAFTPATNTPTSTSTTTFTPEPTGTPAMTPFPTPLQGKGSISLQISCFLANPQGFTAYMPVGSKYPISLILANYQSMTYSPVANDVTDTESRVFFNNIDPGVYSLYFGVAFSEIPASYTVPSITVIENETQDLGEVELPIDCARIYR